MQRRQGPKEKINILQYRQTSLGTFPKPKAELIFTQTTFQLFNLDVFLQAQLLIGLMCIIGLLSHIKSSILNESFTIKFHPSIFILASCGLAYSIGKYVSKQHRQFQKQRAIIAACIFIEFLSFLAMIRSSITDISLETWNMLTTVSIILHSLLIIASPLQSLLVFAIDSVFAQIIWLTFSKYQLTEPEIASESYFAMNGLNLNSLISSFADSELRVYYAIFSIGTAVTINLIQRKAWMYIDANQKLEKNSSAILKNNMSISFIIDSKWQFMLTSSKADEFLEQKSREMQFQHNQRINSFTQLLSSQEQIQFFQEKINEVSLEQKEIEFEIWIGEEEFSRMGTSLQQFLLYKNKKGLTAKENDHKQQSAQSPQQQQQQQQSQQPLLQQQQQQSQSTLVSQSGNEHQASSSSKRMLYKVIMGPVLWKSSKMVQVILQEQSKVKAVSQVIEKLFEQTLSGSEEWIGHLEKNYLKWYNFIEYYKIKPDDLKDLSHCIHAYHHQYVQLVSMRSINNELHGIHTMHANEFDLKGNIIQAIEIVLANKIQLVNTFELQFEGSFPSHNVTADDVFFHQMMMSILDTILPVVEEKVVGGATSQFNNQSSSGIKNLMPQQVMESVKKKFDLKMKCDLKQVIENEIYELLLKFEFHCLDDTRELFQSVFNRVSQIENNTFLQTSDFIDKSQDYIRLLLLFLKLKRLGSEFGLHKKLVDPVVAPQPVVPANPNPSSAPAAAAAAASPAIIPLVAAPSQNSADSYIYVLSLTFCVYPQVQMQTIMGRNSRANRGASSRGASNNFQSNQLDGTKNQKFSNMIRFPDPLNLSFAKDPKNDKTKTTLTWRLQDGKDFNKQQLLKTKKTAAPKIFPNQHVARITKIPTNKEIDSQGNVQQLPSQSNIQQMGASSNALLAQNNTSNTKINGPNGLGIDVSTIPKNMSVSTTMIPMNPNPSTPGGPAGASIFREQQMKSPISNALQVPISSSPKHSSGRKLSLISCTTPIKSPSDDMFGASQNNNFQLNPINTENNNNNNRVVSNISRQASNYMVEEEINTSDEEEKKDSCLATQQGHSHHHNNNNNNTVSSPHSHQSTNSQQQIQQQQQQQQPPLLLQLPQTLSSLNIPTTTSSTNIRPRISQRKYSDHNVGSTSMATSSMFAPSLMNQISTSSSQSIPPPALVPSNSAFPHRGSISNNSSNVSQSQQSQQPRQLQNIINQMSVQDLKLSLNMNSANSSVNSRQHSAEKMPSGGIPSIQDHIKVSSLRGSLLNPNSSSNNNKHVINSEANNESDGTNSNNNNNNALANPSDNQTEKQDQSQSASTPPMFDHILSNAEEDDEELSTLRQAILDSMKLYKNLLIQDASLVVKQLIKTTKNLNNKDISVINNSGSMTSRNTRYQNSISSSMHDLKAGIWGLNSPLDDVENTPSYNNTYSNTPSMQYSQQQQSISFRRGSRGKKKTTLERFTGVASSSTSNASKPINLKKHYNSIQDSPQIDQTFFYQNNLQSQMSQSWLLLENQQPPMVQLQLQTQQSQQPIRSHDFLSPSTSNIVSFQWAPLNHSHTTLNGVTICCKENCANRQQKRTINSSDMTTGGTTEGKENFFDTAADHEQQHQQQHNDDDSINFLPQLDHLHERTRSTHNLLNESPCACINLVDIVKSPYAHPAVNQSRLITHKRKWLNDDLYKKKHFKRSDVVLVKTSNSQLVQQIKQVSQTKKCFSDCRHVRDTFNLISEYQKTMETCKLFFFILIDFEADKSDKPDSVMTEFLANVKNYESLGVPKTYIIGYMDTKQPQGLADKYSDKIDFWISDVQYETLNEYIKGIKQSSNLY